MKPLEGVKVVDLTHALAGPACTYQLSLLGADIIKVENPAGGDDFRGFARGLFDAVNAGKRSLSLNLKSDQALSVLERLVREGDVLVDNFKPGTAEKMGLTWERLRVWNPRIIWCSISGYGLEGPWRDSPAVEWSVQAASGLTDAYVADDADPQYQGLGVLDLSTGHAATTAILAALLLRAKTGIGQRLDVALIDVAMSLSAGKVVAGVAAPVIRPAVGRFKAKDRRIFLMGAHQRWFETMSRVLGGVPLVADSRFATPEARLANVDALREAIEARLAARTADEWEPLFNTAGLPAAVVRSTAEVIGTPHIQQRGVVHQVIVADREETITVVGAPYQMPGLPLSTIAPVPVLGVDTNAVLGELGYGADDIAELRASLVI